MGQVGDPPQALGLSLFFFSLFPLFLRLGSFNHPIFEFTDSFVSADSVLPLSASDKVLNFCILYFLAPEFLFGLFLDFQSMDIFILFRHCLL